jgi:hypothetical protein
VTLNGTLLGVVLGASSMAFEVTSLLWPRNELVVDVEGPAEHGGLWGEVMLEVRCTAYLRDVRVRAIPGPRPELHVEGTVVGNADGPLDLYVILGRSPLAETQVTATSAGTPFHLTARDFDPLFLEEEGERGKPARVQVDLVNGAAVWYTIEGELTFEGAPGPEA